jgi:hypothetical protein
VIIIFIFLFFCKSGRQVPLLVSAVKRLNAEVSLP